VHPEDLADLLVQQLLAVLEAIKPVCDIFEHPDGGLGYSGRRVGNFCHAGDNSPVDPEYSTAQRIAAAAAVLFSAVLLLASLDVALGGRLTRPAVLRYRWGEAVKVGGNFELQPEAQRDADSGLS
jgi:hypothetical protein